MATWRQGILLVMALLLASGGSCQIQRDPGSPIGRRITAPPTDKMWQAPYFWGSSINVLQHPRVAVSSHGDAVATWVEFPPNQNPVIWANNFTWTPSTSLRVKPPCCWGGATRIGDSDAPEVSPDVAMEGRGHALAVWEDGSSIAYNYQAVPGGGRPIMSGTFPDENPQVALDGQGKGLAVWNNLGRVFAGRFTPASGGQWEGQSQEFIAPQTGAASSARVALQQASSDRPGQGVAVWAQGGRIFARRFHPTAGGWEDQPRALSTAGGVARNPAIAMDYLGHAQAVWIQQTSGEDGVFTAHFTPGYGWDTPVSLKIENGNADEVDVAMYPSVVAVAAWKQLHGQNEHAIFARFYAPPIR